MTTVSPRPCIADDCSHWVTGRARLCEFCASFCECGARKSPDRARCRICGSRRAAAANQPPLVRNRRGIYVAQR